MSVGNVAPVAPGVAGGRHEKGPPKFRIQVMWLPKCSIRVDQINVRWRGKIIVVQKTYKKNREKVAIYFLETSKFLYFVGPPKISAGGAEW